VRRFRVPKALHDVFGERTTVMEVALPLAVVILVDLSTG